MATISMRQLAQPHRFAMRQRERAEGAGKASATNSRGPTALDAGPAAMVAEMSRHMRVRAADKAPTPV
jgi:hypothetical protein